MKLADLPQVRALPAEEKLQLVEELLQDMAEDLDRLEVTKTERDVLEERWAKFLCQPSCALTVEETKAKIKKLRS